MTQRRPWVPWSWWYCSTLFDVGVDSTIIQKLAGHSGPATTSSYDRRGDETKRKAVNKLPDL